MINLFKFICIFGGVFFACGVSYCFLNSILTGNVAIVNMYIFNLPLGDKGNIAAGVYGLGRSFWSFFEK